MHTATYPVMESFYTIQGEGYHQGKPAWFVRLAGCNVGCVWCDVKASWDETLYPKQSTPQIILPITQSNTNMVVVTGGEPLMHNCELLTTALLQANYNTHIETSGAYPITGNWKWICVSPKKFKAPLPSVLQAAHELKVVIYNQSDFTWAEQHLTKVNANCKLYLQPEWSKREVITPLIVDYIKKNTHWAISSQVHKYINVP